MSDSAVEIANLLYRYAEIMDSGDLESVAALFRHARIKVKGSEALLDWTGLLDLWKTHVVLYPCGTPRTKHLVTNPIIEVDESADSATTRSYYTVYQAADGFPLQLIAAGRYHDEFERRDGVWRFRYRDYSLMDLVGDMSFHMKVPVTA